MGSNRKRDSAGGCAFSNGYQRQVGQRRECRGKQRRPCGVTIAWNSFRVSTRCVMKFMVEFSVKPGDKNKAAQAFEQRGPNRNPGVAFRGAWIGQNADVVFALVESD